MPTTKNTAKSTASTKVGTYQLSECLAQWEVIVEATASKLGAWAKIGEFIFADGGRGLQAEFVNRTGADKGDISSAVKVAEAMDKCKHDGDEGYDWQDYGSLKAAAKAARLYILGVDELPKSAPKPAGTAKQTGKDVIKSLGKAEAKKLALDILANL
jgi:hypothetical protein